MSLLSSIGSCPQDIVRILDTIREGFQCYDEADLRVLEEQEEILQFEQFRNEEALHLGNVLVELAKGYDNTVGIQIVREEDELVLFQYLRDGKIQRHIQYMQGKRQTSKDTRHSSAWAFVKSKIDQIYYSWTSDGIHVVSGGAFPVSVNGRLYAYVAVSGLHEGKDHELIVNALQKVTGKKCPVFHKVLR